MFDKTLSKGKHIAQRKKERYIRAQVKGTGKYCIEVQVKRTGRHIIRTQAKGTGNIANPGQRQGY